MRKVIFNKWFFLAVLLTISLSAFSIMAYKTSRSVGHLEKECCQNPLQPDGKGEMILEAVSRQFTSLISVP